jgi:hypothetical protein
MQSSPASFDFLPLRSIYSPQHPVLEHPQSMFSLSEVKVKGKVVPVVFLTQHHAMKAYWGSSSLHVRVQISTLIL